MKTRAALLMAVLIPAVAGCGVFYMFMLSDGTTPSWLMKTVGYTGLGFIAFVLLTVFSGRKYGRNAVPSKSRFEPLHVPTPVQFAPKSPFTLFESNDYVDVFDTEPDHTGYSEVLIIRREDDAMLKIRGRAQDLVLYAVEDEFDEGNPVLAGTERDVALYIKHWAVDRSV